jgi:hypothetical protein
MKKFIFALLIGFAGAFYFFRMPVSYGRKLSGYIIAIFERDNGDIVIKMNNDHHDFIIAIGIQLGIDIKRLQSKLIGKRADIWFTHPRWPVNTTPYITRLVCENDIVYTKW